MQNWVLDRSIGPGSAMGLRSVKGNSVIKSELRLGRVGSSYSLLRGDWKYRLTFVSGVKKLLCRKVEI